jgi:hypothetical protein
LSASSPLPFGNYTNRQAFIRLVDSKTQTVHPANVLRSIINSDSAGRASSIGSGGPSRDIASRVPMLLALS